MFVKSFFFLISPFFSLSPMSNDLWFDSLRRYSVVALVSILAPSLILRSLSFLRRQGVQQASKKEIYKLLFPVLLNPTLARYV